jgi:ATP-binding cassette, subfamily B, bacterial
MRPALIVARRLAGFELRRFVVGALLWMPVSFLPIAGGLVLHQVFDRISGDRPAALGQALWLCAAFVGVELARGLMIFIAWSYGTYWWNTAASLLRANVLTSVLGSRGAAASRLPRSSGEALSRLDTDTGDLTNFVDHGVELAGALLFSAGALAVMASIDPVVTLVLVVPMLAVGVLSRLMSELIRRLHLRARELGAVVTAYVGEVFGSVLALKAAGAEEAAMARLREHNRRRRAAAMRDRLATDLMDTATGATVDLSIGLVLLLAASAMRRGDFTVGDLALFTTYVSWLTALPRAIGALLYRLPQAEVATARLGRLMAPHEDVHDLARGPRLPDPPPAGDRLEVLEARGLTVRFEPHGRGIDDVDLRLARGSFTVVTGAVGAGKTTLVRALLGLVPADAGTIAWNGRVVDDPGTFLVPGRAAYASQIPRLFSTSLRDNLLLGAPGEDLGRALTLAVFDRDLDRMPDGLATVVGPRGVRLSGGQVQRATAARALVRSPELLVVDDLSSALDAETERELWRRLAADGPETVLVVSHRRAALERADTVVVLDRGRVVARGPLTDLLRDSPEMRRLWSDDQPLDAAALERGR